MNTFTPPQDKTPTPASEAIKISWCDGRLVRQASPIQGHGVFSLAPITQGEIVVVFGGFVVSLTELRNLESVNPRAHRVILDVGFQIADDLIYSPVDESTFSVAEYLNHSCQPNCGFAGEVTLIAMRHIAMGEELNLDYAMCISNSIFEMECGCGSDGCRGRLSAEDWKNPVLQTRYRGCFQPYLTRKIVAAFGES